jgi:hypothetical protein
VALQHMDMKLTKCLEFLCHDTGIKRGLCGRLGVPDKCTAGDQHIYVKSIKAVGA